MEKSILKHLATIALLSWIITPACSKKNNKEIPTGKPISEKEYVSQSPETEPPSDTNTTTKEMEDAKELWEEFKKAEMQNPEKIEEMLQDTLLDLHLPNQNETIFFNPGKTWNEKLAALQKQNAKISYKDEIWMSKNNVLLLKATRIIKYRWEEKKQKIGAFFYPNINTNPPSHIKNLLLSENPSENPENPSPKKIATPLQTKFDGKTYVLTKEVPENAGWILTYQPNIPNGEPSEIIRKKIASQTQKGLQGPNPKKIIDTEESIAKTSEGSIEFFTKENPKPYEWSYWKLTKTKKPIAQDNLEITRMREDPEGGTLQFTFLISGKEDDLKARFPKEKSLSDWNKVPWPGEDPAPNE